MLTKLGGNIIIIIKKSDHLGTSYFCCNNLLRTRNFLFRLDNIIIPVRQKSDTLRSRIPHVESVTFGPL